MAANGERRVLHRRYAPKTRSGCVTCKIRRVKCDEAKPACQRCVTTGRKCDGYVTTPPEQDSNQLDVLNAALSTDLASDTLERRTFEFFRAKTGPTIAGYFPDPVWDRYVLQMAQAEPTVRYAVNALGALHEERWLRNRSDTGRSPVATNFPLIQYSKALNGLQDMLGRGTVPLDMVLMCALLMVHFEALRESFLPALAHIESATKLLQSKLFGSAPPDTGIVRAMVRLDIQGSLYVGMRVPSLPFVTSAVESAIPTALHDLVQARDLVNTWSARVLHFLHSETYPQKFGPSPSIFPLEMIARSHELSQTFVDLDQLLWELLHRPSSRFTIREQHGLGMLRCRVKIDRILASCAVYTEATMFDAYIDQFRTILSICKFIMESDKADRHLFTVSLDEGLIWPMFFVVTHCRDSRIRHEALDQLRQLPVRRGVWHLEAMLRTSEMCVAYEEALCDTPNPKPSDIPEWRRIHSSGFVQPNKRTPSFSMNLSLRTRPNGMDGEWMDVNQTITRQDRPFRERYGRNTVYTILQN